MIHNIRYRIFVYEDENEEGIMEGLFNILPTAKPDKEIAEGVFENQIVILSGRISKKNELKDFVSTILNSGIDLEDFSKNLDKKMDDKGNLFLRFSKKEACENEIKIIDSGDSIHLKLKIAAYPAKKEIAIEIAKKLFN
jgi:RNA binding exosome subunit